MCLWCEGSLKLKFNLLWLICSIFVSACRADSGASTRSDFAEDVSSPVLIYVTQQISAPIYIPPYCMYPLNALKEDTVKVNNSQEQTYGIVQCFFSSDYKLLCNTFLNNISIAILIKNRHCWASTWLRGKLGHVIITPPVFYVSNYQIKAKMSINNLKTNRHFCFF